jgi:hypothetical protein
MPIIATIKELISNGVISLDSVVSLDENAIGEVVDNKTFDELRQGFKESNKVDPSMKNLKNAMDMEKEMEGLNIRCIKFCLAKGEFFSNNLEKNENESNLNEILIEFFVSEPEKRNEIFSKAVDEHNENFIDTVLSRGENRNNEDLVLYVISFKV